jgi:hypothetical protein
MFKGSLALLPKLFKVFLLEVLKVACDVTTLKKDD